MLFDFGPSERMIKNAQTLGVDLSQADIAVLSHGHYDHSGGLPAFAGVNNHAKLFMQKNARGDYYSQDTESAYRYIGIEPFISGQLQTICLSGDETIDDELSLFVTGSRRYPIPASNRRLKMRINGRYVQDSFEHEQSLVITEHENMVLIAGCAHNGILNILDTFVQKYQRVPDAVFGGFHLMQKEGYSGHDLNAIRSMAHELKQYPTAFYTCHCTGAEPFECMRGIMGDQLSYIHTGEEIQLSFDKRAVSRYKMNL